LKDKLKIARDGYHLLCNITIRFLLYCQTKTLFRHQISFLIFFYYWVQDTIVHLC